MKLIRYGETGNEKPGLQLDDGRLVDTSSIVNDYNEEFFASSGLEKLQEWASANADNAEQINANHRIGSPIARPSKMICIGLNFSDHAAETGAETPKEPVIFSKATSALSGPFDNIVIPKGSEQTDWEVELAIVISKYASYISETEAEDYIAGYILHNDVSERSFQKDRGGQWTKGKSSDTFAPLGPFMATKDEIPDTDNLAMWLTVNGEKMQDGNTSNLIFNVPHVVSYLTNFMSLLPGDVISTGTPAGVGMGMDPERYLKPGDVVELGIDGLGSSRQNVVAYSN
ncbi:MAG: fumarylacetoacetate hydrolase family protein [Akkermansiaceae bacterium]|jgi:2,4-didehydro-3-deoxy-L-rhamnonate hydrolase|nr:fumarylacetoacetate hydrolase family protein [Akkermansiaceae bacterium]